MARFHLFEWEDFSWFPSALRDYGTDFLQFLADKSGMYRPVSPLLTELLSRSNHTRIIDLCSGGGGAYRKLSGLMSKDCTDLKITLTDYYPNVKALQKIQNEIPEIDFDERKVDARDVPADLKGLRTLFLSFHHFKPEDAKRILQNAVDTGSPIAIIEAQERSVTSILAMLFSPVSVLLTTPFIRPFRWGRLFFLI